MVHLDRKELSAQLCCIRASQSKQCRVIVMSMYLAFIYSRCNKKVHLKFQTVSTSNNTPGHYLTKSKNTFTTSGARSSSQVLIIRKFKNLFIKNVLSAYCSGVVGCCTQYHRGEKNINKNLKMMKSGIKSLSNSVSFLITKQTDSQLANIPWRVHMEVCPIKDQNKLLSSISAAACFS